MYDTIIIGGGPAGVAAGVYAGRKELKSALITESFGGQSVVSDSIENWIGDKTISGFDLVKRLEGHINEYSETIDIKKEEKVERVEKDGNNFLVKTNKEEYKTKTVIITSGGRRRKLNIPGEEKLNGRGVVYCSTCDAPLFREKTVAVVGGGNSGLEAVIDLFPYAKKIYLLNWGETPTGDISTLEEVEKSDKTQIINMAETTEIIGDTLVTGIKYKDRNNEEIKELKLDGVFIEIGSKPNSEIVKELLEINEFGEIIVDHRNYETSVKGVFAAGDVTDEIYKQNNIAVGDAITALLSAYNYILKINKKSPAGEK